MSPAEGGNEGPARAQPFIRTFACTGCGARLSFAPGTASLRCESCGTANAIAGNEARVEELDLESWVKQLEGRQETIEEELVKCAKCGAEQHLDAALFASKCSFCGTAIVSKAYASRHIKPRAMVPFQLDRERAQGSFRNWLRWRWLAPNDLKRYARTDATLTGVYLPFWTYDCRTATDYAGARGMKRDKSTDWTRVTGHVALFHDDVVVLASRTLPPGVLDALSRWDTRALVPYQAEYVSGFGAEAYQVGLAEAYPLARRLIDRRIQQAIAREIGGDRQRIDSVDTRYEEVTFKHVLMPAWISAYRYRDKVYRYLVNGQTGEASGESPLSWVKVALLAIVALIVFFAWAASQ